MSVNMIILLLLVDFLHLQWFSLLIHLLLFDYYCMCNVFLAVFGNDEQAWRLHGLRVARQ